MFVICVNKSSAENKKWCDDRKIIHTFVVVVVVELRLELRWLLNEITIRERVEEHAMAASFALHLVRLLALEKKVCWSDRVFIVMVRACAYPYLSDCNNQWERWVWSRGLARSFLIDSVLLAPSPCALFCWCTPHLW